MSELAGTAMILGGVLAMLYAPLVFFPGKALAWLKAFPRTRWIGWVLAAVDLLWAGWLLYATPLPWFEAFKAWLWVLVPVIFVLVVLFMDELLAPRALGGLMLLAPAPVLKAAFMHESSFRLVVVVIAYILAVKGIILVLSPYQFRKGVAFFVRSAQTCRVLGLVGLTLSVGVIILGIAAY